MTTIELPFQSLCSDLRSLCPIRDNAPHQAGQPVSIVHRTNAAGAVSSQQHLRMALHPPSGMLPCTTQVTCLRHFHKRQRDGVRSQLLRNTVHVCTWGYPGTSEALSEANIPYLCCIGQATRCQQVCHNRCRDALPTEMEPAKLRRCICAGRVQYTLSRNNNAMQLLASHCRGAQCCWVCIGVHACASIS